MIVAAGICALLLGVAVFYRRRLSGLAVQMVLGYLILYVKARNWYFSRLRTTHVSKNIAVCVDKDTYVHHYDIVVYDKWHSVHYITDSSILCNPEEKCKKVREQFHKRNKLVHCSIVDTSEDYTIDLTDIFRGFVYHFDEKDEQSKLGHFIKYIGHLYAVPLEDMYFIVYLNDEHFTECKYKIEQLGDTRFSDVLGVA